jgi:DNA invertase Pin-like site-specific DNA recombinase
VRYNKNRTYVSNKDRVIRLEEKLDELHIPEVDLTCKGVVISYCRVSHKLQNEMRQVAVMKKLGIPDDKIFVDKASGKDFDRPEYKKMRDYVIRAGDLLLLDSLDRLGRDYDGIIREWNIITKEKNADILTLEYNQLFDSRKFKAMGDIGKMLETQMLSLLSFCAEQERKKIKERQKVGILIAQQEGKVVFGRPKINLDTLSKEQKQILKEYYSKWKDSQIAGVQFMKLLDLKKNSFYKIIKQYEETLLEEE